MAICFREAQWLGALPLGPNTYHHVQNVKNVQNVIHMAFKWLFFSQKKLQELPSDWGVCPYSGNLLSYTQSSPLELDPFILLLIFKFKFIDFAKLEFKFINNS